MNTMNKFFSGLNSAAEEIIRRYWWLFAILIVGGLAFDRFDPRVEARVDRAVSALKSATLPELVPDEIVRRMVRNLESSPAEGRHYVFGESVCKPILSGAGDREYPQDWREGDEIQYCGRCSFLLYDAYSANEEAFWENDASYIPAGKREAIAQTRGAIMEIARNYLKDRDALWAFYEAKRGAIVEEMLALPEHRRDALLRKIALGVEGMKLSANPEIRVLVDRVVEAEKGTLLDLDSFGEFRTAVKELETALGQNAFEKRYALQFALRREAEGGQELVRTWTLMGEDMLNEMWGDAMWL